MFHFSAACGSFIGNGREENQDNFYFNKKHLPSINRGTKNPIKAEGATDEPIVFAVFDGMGGESKGEEAAFLCSKVFSEEAKKLAEIVKSGKEYMYEACEKANIAVNEFRKEKQVNSMGSTVAALHMSQEEITACNVGDSKIFRIRENRMTQISEDHTDAKILAAMGVDKKPVLLQYIGVPDTEMAIEPYISKGTVMAGDTYILCSDGVTDFLLLEQLYDIVSKNDAFDAVKLVLAKVDENNGTDNATVIVLNII